jgi:hypothetical protein
MNECDELISIDNMSTVIVGVLLRVKRKVMP